MPSSFLSPSVFTPYPTLLLSVWHQRAGTLEGVVVWRGQLTPPTPLQSMCITAKHNGEPCECHQYAARGDVVTPQTKWFSKWHTILRLQLMFSHYDSQSLKKKCKYLFKEDFKVTCFVWQTVREPVQFTITEKKKLNFERSTPANIWKMHLMNDLHDHLNIYESVCRI